MSNNKRYVGLLFFKIIFLTQTAISQCHITGKTYNTIIDYEACDNRGYLLVYEDQFYEERLNNTRWALPYQGVIRDFNFTMEKQWYENTSNLSSINFSSGHNVNISNGKLKLIARKEQSTFTGTYHNWQNYGNQTTSSFQFTSGQIESKRKFGYGYYEIRCKIPKGQNYWPAFWLFTTPWSEIDVFEFWNENNLNNLSKNVHLNIHSTWGGQQFMCQSEYNNGTDYSEEFHTFGLEYTPTKIIWYIDDYPVRTSYRYVDMITGQLLDCNIGGKVVGAKYFPNGIYHNILANLAIQNGNNAIVNGTPNYGEFEIDWIRYYTKGTCTPINITSLNLHSENFNYVSGSQVTVNGNINITNNQFDIIANESIQIKPGFKASAGSTVLMKIDASACGINSRKESNNWINDDEQEQKILNLRINDTEIYPNPFNENLVINNLNPYDINIFTLTGEICFQDKNVSGLYTIDTSKYPKGIYLIKIYDNVTSEEFVSKIVKTD